MKSDIARLDPLIDFLVKKMREKRKSDIARLDTIRSPLGHKDSKTTEIYTHVTKTATNKIVSPIDNLGIK